MKKPKFKLLNKNHHNYSLMIVETLIYIDLWLLIKTRRLIHSISPTIKMLLFMGLGASLVLAYTLIYPRFSIIRSNDVLHSSSENQVSSSKYLQIDDNSDSDDQYLLEKDLMKIKNDIANLEKSLQKMNLYLKNHHFHHNLDTNLPDFASEAGGGVVVSTPKTEPFYPVASDQMTFFGINLWKPSYYTPRKVIQPWTQAGECWAFQGSQGKIEIELSHTIIIDKVTLEHIPISASLTGKIDSAPKSFNVLGKLDNSYAMLDTFTYNKSGLSSQIFEITKPEMKNIPFKRIILDIISNWGNPLYTCIYRFKVHGKIFSSENENNYKVQ